MTNSLPTGWTIASIGQIAELSPRHPRDLDEHLPVSFVPMAGVNEDRPEFSFKEERLFGKVKQGFTHFAEGDVLFAKITPCMENGKAAVVEGLKNGLGCGSTEFHVMRPHRGINSKYLYHFIHQESFRHVAKHNFTGTAGQARVPISFVRDAAIPLPPESEQIRIVEKLERLLGKVAGCNARLERIPIILKRFRQSVLAAACSGRLTADWRAAVTSDEAVQQYCLELNQLRRVTWQKRGKKAKYAEPIQPSLADVPEIPSSWQWISADAMCYQITDGEHIQPPYQSEGYPMLSAKHVRDGYVTLEGAGLISEDAFNTSIKRCEPVNGDILVVSVGATTGRAAIVEKAPPFALVRSVLLLKPITMPRYVLRWMQSQWCFRWMTLASGASAQPHLYIRDIKRMPIPLPPKGEQQEIVRRVESLFTLADQLEARYKKGKAYVDKLTQSILAKAFRGELVPQDPNDEPAEKLLERIRAGTSICSKAGRST